MLAGETRDSARELLRFDRRRDGHRLAVERSLFDFDSVVHALADKLLRRHPHVFGPVKVSGSAEVLRNWEAIKASEKADGPRSVIEGVPRHLPALQKAQRVQSRAARVGFDWPDAVGAFAKTREEFDEVEAELLKLNKGRGGLIDLIGTADFREVERRLDEGDAEVARVYEAMIYQISKEITSLLPAFDGEPVDRVLLTGGLARSERLVADIERGVAALGCGVTAYPGENEMYALVKGALRVLNGKERARDYDPRPATDTQEG